MSENNRVHAINAIAERLPLSPTETLPADESLSTYGEDVFGEKMIRTPTYHVMHMYRHHQGGELLASEMSGVNKTGPEEFRVPAVTESVSEKDGVITITLSNLSMTEAESVDVSFAGKEEKEIVEARIVTGTDCHDYNLQDSLLALASVP